MVDKVKDFFGDVTAGAKESFAQITGSAVSKGEEEAEANTSSTPRDERSSGSQRRASVSTLKLLHYCSVTCLNPISILLVASDLIT